MPFRWTLIIEIQIPKSCNYAVISSDELHRDIILTLSQLRASNELYCTDFSEPSRSLFHVTGVSTFNKLPAELSPFQSLHDEHR